MVTAAAAATEVASASISATNSDFRISGSGLAVDRDGEAGPQKWGLK